MTQPSLKTKLKKLNEIFPKLGIACPKLSIEENLDVVNQLQPVFMQFRPKLLSDLIYLDEHIIQTKTVLSLHQPTIRFNKTTGHFLEKDNLLNILSYKTKHAFDLITLHPIWNNADVILDKQNKWQKNNIAITVLHELAALTVAAIRTKKIIAFENLRYRSLLHPFQLRLGSMPAHLITIYDQVAKMAAQYLKQNVQTIKKHIGYTLDVGHAMGSDDRLTNSYPLKKWFKMLRSNIKLLHLHDVQCLMPIKSKMKTDHLALGSGLINWSELFDLKQTYCPNAWMILELKTIDAIEQSIDYLLKIF